VGIFWVFQKLPLTRVDENPGGGQKYDRQCRVDTFDAGTPKTLDTHDSENGGTVLA